MMVQGKGMLAAGAAAILAVGLTAAAGARDMGQAMVVGKVTNTTGSKLSRKIFVQAGKQKWAFHVGRTDDVFHGKRRVSLHDIDLGTWVRGRGRRIGTYRLEPTRIDIAGDRAAYRKSDAYRASAPNGYVVINRR